MEDVLAVYTRPRDPDYPLVCLDETSHGEIWVKGKNSITHE
jgi:hypothetical protein